MRPDSTAESLAKLKPVFERPGQSHRRQFLADHRRRVPGDPGSEEAVAKYGLTPKAVILDSQWSALDPGIMGLGPVLSPPF